MLSVIASSSLSIEAFADIAKPKINLQVPPKETFESIFDEILADYKKEFDQGCAIFERPSSTSTSPTLSLTNENFIERRVGAGCGGPDEAVLKNGDSIFQTNFPVLSTEECNELVSEAQQTINKGLSEERESSPHPTNSQLGEARVSEMPLAREWLRGALHERLFPLLESRFGVPAGDLTLQDALVIGYGCMGRGSKSQPIHRDSSLISLNVALSPRTDYEDGGTFFEPLPAESSVISNDIGHIVCHAGGMTHAGRGIASGQRWVLVLFCIAKDRPEFARRCRLKGMSKKEEGDLQEAKSIFQAGLSLAPDDHLLLTSLGGVYMAEGNEEAAMECLVRAAEAYPQCQKANLALGKMMMANRRPFAALHHFDAVLEWMNDRDLSEKTLPQLRAIGFDARVIGSQAALFCSQQAKEQGFDDFPWRSCTEQALARLNSSLESTPGDRRILNMIALAEEILEAA
jgi:tetratricopeptide (TPR) repeat protein